MKIFRILELTTQKTSMSNFTYFRLVGTITSLLYGVVLMVFVPLQMQARPKVGAEMAGKPPECCDTPKPAAPAGAPAGPLLPSVSGKAPAACQTLELAGASCAAHSPGRQTKLQFRYACVQSLRLLYRISFVIDVSNVTYVS